MFTGIIEETGRVAAFTQDRILALQVAAKLVPSDVKLGRTASRQRLLPDGDKVRRRAPVVRRARGNATPDQFLPSSRRSSAREPVAQLRADTVSGAFWFPATSMRPAGSRCSRCAARIITEVSVPAGFARYLVYKGSVAIDGISLTCGSGGRFLAVWLIRTTLAVTNLRGKKASDTLNLEFDLLAKYIESSQPPARPDHAHPRTTPCAQRRTPPPESRRPAGRVRQ